MVFSYNDAAFRAQFPAFVDTTAFPQSLLSAYFTTGGSYISTTDYGYINGASRQLALNLMTAHLAQIGAQIASGQGTGIVTGATIDKVTVTLGPPPVKDMFKWWLAQTPYGQQLLAMLSVAAVGGFAIGGSCTRAGFRGNGSPLFW